ncbi:hypothetical protein OE88DRAFT_441369 [Heliocybe sulcata]|uniref:RING-type domain-containing protein n=1 Tax=Heliocybe sulcata TaxID=5364 RepID=A0A5C3MUZ9_9AGAM|nr:hypothetical protein OE88DRAFT_441369 [Heliocybe sulcata]
MSHSSSYRPESTSRATHVAPYLTHVVAHHGQLTLIPPDNAGRMRKARTKKHKTKEGRRKTDASDASDVSVVLTAASARLAQDAEPEPVPRPSSRSVEERRQIRHFVDSIAIPDFPPPSFQEAIATGSSYQPFSPSGNGSSAVLSGQYMAMPSTYSLATTLHAMHPYGPQFSQATPPPSPYSARDNEGDDYDSGSEASEESIEYLGPSETHWDEDRRLGFSLEQRVERERERRVVTEETPLSPATRSPPLSPLRLPNSPISERSCEHSEVDEHPRARSPTREILRDRSPSPTRESSEMRRLAGASVTTLFLSRRVRGDAHQHERPASPTDEAGRFTTSRRPSTSNLLSRSRRAETEPSQDSASSPNGDEADPKRIAGSSMSNLLFRRLLSRSKKGPSPLKTSSGPHDSSPPLSSPSSFSLSIFNTSQPSSPTGAHGHAHVERAQSPTLTTKSLPLANGRRRSIPSLQVFSSLKGKRRGHENRNSESSSGETLDSWHIVDDEEIPDTDTPSLEIDLCAEFPAPPDHIPIPGDPNPPRTQSPTSPILGPASPKDKSGLAKIRKALASASTLNLNLMSKQDLTSRPFTGQPTAVDVDQSPSSSTRVGRGSSSTRAETQCRYPHPSPPEKCRSPPGSPISPIYTQYSLPISPVSQDHSECIHLGSPVSVHRSQRSRPGSPVSAHNPQSPRSISPTLSNNSQIPPHLSPTFPKPKHQVYLPRPASPVSSSFAAGTAPSPAMASPSKPKRRPPPPPPPRRAAHKQNAPASVSKSFNAQTPNNTASSSGISGQLEATTAASSAATESTDSLDSKVFSSVSCTDSSSSLPRAFASDRGSGPDERTAAAESSSPFRAPSPDANGFDREILTPRAAPAGLPTQTSSRYSEELAREPRSPLSPSAHQPSRNQPMSPLASRHHYPGRPLPVPPSARPPTTSGFPISPSDTGSWREKQALLAQSQQAERDGAGPSNVFTAPPPSYTASRGQIPDHTPSPPSSTFRNQPPLSPVRSPVVITQHAVAPAASPLSVAQGLPSSPEFSPYTDLDVLLSRVENGDGADGANYEDLLLLSEMVGPARSGPASRATDEKENMPLLGRIEVERRRITKDGRVKLKLSLIGVSVDKCGICLSQFKEAQWAALGAECQHAFHEKCLRPWLARKRTCPMCRSSLSVDSS